MNVRVDKRLFEILSQQGASVTWEQFRAAYAVRQKEREERLKDPKVQARRAREAASDAAFLEALARYEAQGTQGV